MKRVAWLLLFCIGIGLALPSSQAARDVAVAPTPGPNLQLVVLEVDGCIYCDVFRQRLLPAYQSSKQGKRAPIRFVDINDPALGDFGLTQPIGTVPTFIMLENNQEIGRIPGLMGREDFFKAVDWMLIGR
ncbi:MAG: thioredoxin family protein [Alphaproteobacteria bacterium]|nr:thioredoxin family protein [Alphaproteobacteria bacterium]